VSDDLVGIASHGGEHSHAHWVSLDGTLTTHLDRWGLKAGAILLLPKTIMSHVWFWQRLGRADHRWICPFIGGLLQNSLLRCERAIIESK